MTDMKNIRWNFDETTGTLTIGGQGRMPIGGLRERLPWTGLVNDIRRVVVEDGVENIAAFAFTGCKNLKDVELAGVKSIGGGAFMGCTSLASVTLPATVEIVQPLAFAKSGLIAVEIPESVKLLSDNAFEKCGDLTYLMYTGTAGQWAKLNSSKSACPEQASVYCAA